MKRPLSLVVGTAAAALLVAAIGASAHTGGFFGHLTGVHTIQLSEDASGARGESPEPSDSPEASPSSEPTETPEASPKAEPTEAPDSEDASDDGSSDSDVKASPSPEASPSGGSDDGGGGDGGD